MLEGAARVGAAYVTGGMSEAALAGSQIASTSGGGGWSMDTGMSADQVFKSSVL